ncbi:hypothetical protein [Saccharopolyspora shandongensis]|uniref:hypothetical protein n=1 Tax=Saccharopolyspora shandongensis TaxID=418495 RepID=UPI0033FA7833
MKDVEILIGQVWSPDVRPLVEEAWRCYKAGAVRAGIASTWTAVAADIVTKLVWMADDGDGQAQQFHTKLKSAQQKGLTKDGVRAMQEIESSLLEQAVKFELIDSIDARELERIREDRNLCVHTSLRTSGEVYEAREEVARAHLVTALSVLLTHPPIQGGKLLDEFRAHICNPRYVPAPAHIQATFYDRLRAKARSTIVELAAKHALLELDTKGRLPEVECADRMAAALLAFAQRDRELVRTAVAKCIGRFPRLEGDQKWRALARFGEQDFFWDNLDQAQREHLQTLVANPITGEPLKPLPDRTATVLALVRSSYARERLPALETQFAELSTTQQMSVIKKRPDPYFVPTVLELLREARSWYTGGEAGQALVELGPYLTIDTLRTALKAWAENFECRASNPMPEAAVRLFRTTELLGQERIPVFGEFLSKVRESGNEDSHPALGKVLQAHGHTPPAENASADADAEESTSSQKTAAGDSSAML